MAPTGNPDRRNLENKPKDANRDPITGAPGSHPVGTGVGAAGGGLAGAAVGSLGGPIGTAVGAAAGAIAGGLVGKGAGEAVNPTAEEAYWRDNYASRPYVRPGTTFNDFAPAYRYGWEAYTDWRPQGLTYDQAEPRLRERWETSRGPTSLDWDSARGAIRDAWTRLEERWDSAGGGTSPRARTGTESKTTPKEVRDSLNDLIQICKDGAAGYQLAAEKADPQHASLFRQYASERAGFAAELQSEVRALGGDPVDSGNASAALHRGWMNIKSAVTSGDKAIVDECERGEDSAVEAYQKVLRANPPADVYAVVARQYTKVKGAHDRVSALKHSLA